MTKPVLGTPDRSGDFFSSGVQQTPPNLSEKRETEIFGANVSNETSLQWTWRVSLECVRSSFDAVTELFFRVLGLVAPLLGARVESVWFRCKTVAANIKRIWQQESSRREMALLQEENSSLKGRISTLEKGQSSFEAVTQENGTLHALVAMFQREVEALKLKLDTEKAEKDHSERSAALLRVDHTRSLSDAEAMRKELETLRSLVSQTSQKKLGEQPTENTESEGQDNFLRNYLETWQQREEDLVKILSAILPQSGDTQEAGAPQNLIEKALGQKEGLLQALEAHTESLLGNSPEKARLEALLATIRGEAKMFQVVRAVLAIQYPEMNQVLV